MAVFERAEAACLAFRTIDRRAHQARKDIHAGRPCGALAEREEEAAAARDERPEPLGGELRHGRVVEHDDRGALHIVCRERVDGLARDVEPRRVAKRERPHGLWLWTFVSNEGAQRFYERHGFAEVERTDGRANEERAPDVLYAWSGVVGEDSGLG